MSQLKKFCSTFRSPYSDVWVFFESIVREKAKWTTERKYLAFFHSLLKAVKHSYGFINSILLIVLLRSFQEPAKMFFRWCKGFCFDPDLEIADDEKQVDNRIQNSAKITG